MRAMVKWLLAASLVAMAPITAQAADPVRGVYAAQPDACVDARVFNRISKRFDHQVRNVPNLPQVGILDFYNVRHTRYEPAYENSPVERRYCHGVVYLSNGHRSDLWFLIENPMGFAGIGSNVEFCVSGFDRWHVYGGNCRVLR